MFNKQSSKTQILLLCCILMIALLMIEFLNLLIDFRKLFCADNYIIKLYNYIALEPPKMRHIRKFTQ